MGQPTNVTFSGNVPGPWGVDAVGRTWCVINRKTGRTKRIGPVCRPGSAWSKINYFDRAIGEADKRNRELSQKMLELLEQRVACQRAFNQDPTPRLAAALKQLEAAIKKMEKRTC